MTDICFTSHHNWEWVVKNAINDLSSPSLTIKQCRTLRELPSQQLKREKSTYALFRVEKIDTCNNKIYCNWVSSTAFIELDFKDSLYSKLKINNAENTMPITTLLEWDISSIDDICWDFNCLDQTTSNHCVLLKSACGSGGFGLYKCFSKSDIFQVIKYHADMAKSHDGFIQNLKNSNSGKIPCWSLQTFLNSVRVLNNRKCQIRAYIIYCNETKSIYLYKDYEVRLPFWEDIEQDETCVSSNTNSFDTAMSTTNLVPDFEKLCVMNTTAVPYNKHRMKENTERYMLNELTEISHTYNDIRTCLKIAILALLPICQQTTTITENHKDDSSLKDITHTQIKYHKSCIAIAGIDLILYEGDSLERKLIPKILEINNNPAMPHPSKKMSEKYRSHLQSFVRNTILLGLSVSGSFENNSACNMFNFENMCN